MLRMSRICFFFLSLQKNVPSRIIYLDISLTSKRQTPIIVIDYEKLRNNYPRCRSNEEATTVYVKKKKYKVRTKFTTGSVFVCIASEIF